MNIFTWNLRLDTLNVHIHQRRHTIEIRIQYSLTQFRLTFASSLANLIAWVQTNLRFFLRHLFLLILTVQNQMLNIIQYLWCTSIEWFYRIIQKQRGSSSKTKTQLLLLDEFSYRWFDFTRSLDCSFEQKTTIEWQSIDI